MAWYRNGTVTVTNGSTTVTGSGTAFVANVKIGEGFLGPEGRVYEIADIPSNTELTLATAYTGATAGAQAYAILPTQSALADLAEQAAELVNSFAVVRDGVGQGLFESGTQASPGVRFASDQDTGMFRPAPNMVGFASGGTERLRAHANGANVYGVATVDGHVDAGVQSTQGALGLTIGYPGVDRLATLGSLRSSSAVALGFAVKPSSSVANGWVSSASNASWKRAGLALSGDDFTIGFAAAQSTARDEPVALTTRIVVESGGPVRPGEDNVQTLGTAGRRWSTVYAGTGTINTSDERDKTWRGTLTDAEYLAGCTVLDELGFYQFNEVIDEKGPDGARYHFGVRAQQVWAAFAAQGLVDPIGVDGKPGATPYGFLCFDEWDEETAPVLDDGGEPTGATTVVREAGFQYGIRPDELALFLIAVQARRQAELDDELAAQAARISALEAA